METHSQVAAGGSAEIDFDPLRTGFGGVHGGLVAAVPWSTTVHFLAPVPSGPFALRPAPVPVPTPEPTANHAPFRDASPWHLVRHRAAWASPTPCVDETELFTADGEPAAQGRRLRRITTDRRNPHA